jgi:hypothetical protein
VTTQKEATGYGPSRLRENSYNEISMVKKKRGQFALLSCPVLHKLFRINLLRG